MHTSARCSFPEKIDRSRWHSCGLLRWGKGQGKRTEALLIRSVAVSLPWPEVRISWVRKGSLRRGERMWKEMERDGNFVEDGDKT
jgi:hypothetical protein